jgi:hypothetical protein
MPITYSYNSLTAFRTPAGQYGWIYTVQPATVYSREGISRQPETTRSIVSYPGGLAKPPHDSETICFRHVAGGAAGDRQWHHQARSPGSLEEAAWQDEKDRLLHDCRDAVEKGLMPLDPESLLSRPRR